MSSFLITTTGSSFLTEKTDCSPCFHRAEEPKADPWCRTSRAMTNAMTQEQLNAQLSRNTFPCRTDNSFGVDYGIGSNKSRKKLDVKQKGCCKEIKSSFGLEPYLSLPNHKKTRCTTWLRTSSHKLDIETGRYGWKNSSIFYRACHFCCTSDRITLDLLNELPLSGIIKEDDLVLVYRATCHLCPGSL